MPRLRAQFPDPPILASGDHLTRDEFERRYAAMHESFHAELIEGVVHVASPVRSDHHGQPHAAIVTALGVFAASSTAIRLSDDATVRLDMDNEPQPDATLFVDPTRSGQTSLSEDGYIEGAPELVVEIAASSVSIDLHEKFRAYRRNGVPEYVVWRVLDGALDWFVLERGSYVAISRDADGLIRSRGFPGLWLDVDALLDDRIATVIEQIRAGIASPAHADFVRTLESASD